MKWRMRLLVGAIVTAIAGAAMAGWPIARTSSARVMTFGEN